MLDMYSIFVSRTGGKTKQLSIKRNHFIGLLCVFFVIIIMAIASIFFGHFYVKNYQYLHDKNMHIDNHENVLQNLEFEINSLRKMVELLIQKEEKIRQDLGEPKYRKLSKRRLIKYKHREFLEAYPETISDEHAVFKLSYDLAYIKTFVLELESKMRRHSRRYNQYVSWFNSMPSIYPVYGHIRSGYGWRFHPLKRTRQFHKGNDVPAWVGAPVQATADGFVQFAGWAGGYGWMIVVSHDFGYQTLYAHLSEIQTLQGAQVKKGEIIGKIGSSGMSTGPHVHYEVRYRKKAVDPNIYLNLDLFTAVSKLW